MIDINEHISAVRRQVGTRTLEAGEARVVTLTRTYGAPVDDVWDACTSVERIPRWFLPITGDLRVGGRYQLQGNAGGVVERCDPPRSFAATWEFGGDVSSIEVRLDPAAAGGTVLTLEHVGHVDDEFWDRFGPGAVGLGWEGGLLGLAGHLGAPGVPKPADSEAWAVSDEGRAFMTRSARAWCDAHIAAGADPAAAAGVGGPDGGLLHGCGARRRGRGGPRGGGVTAAGVPGSHLHVVHGMKVAFLSPRDRRPDRREVVRPAENWARPGSGGQAERVGRPVVARRREAEQPADRGGVVVELHVQRRHLRAAPPRR